MNVDQVLDKILGKEGGYVNDSDDRGGETNFGITQDTLDRMGIRKSVKGISKDDAKAIYLAEYYIKPKIDTLPENIQHKVLDMSVNHGPINAIKILQNALIKTGIFNNVISDGIIGPITQSASRFVTVKELVSERVGFYADIVANDHRQAKFLKGWLNRARSFL